MQENDLPYFPKKVTPSEKVIPVADCNFHTYFWSVERDPKDYKGRILILHGYRDLRQVYYYFLEQLALNGYDVFYFDQRGEGETVLKNGKKGTTNDEHAFKAVDYFIEYNQKELEQEAKEGKVDKAKKLSILSVSMGGGISLNYAAIGKYASNLAGMVNIAPLILLHEKTYPGRITEFVVRTLCAIPGCQSLHVKTNLHPEYISGDSKYSEYIRERDRKSPLSATLVESRDFILRGRRLLLPAYYKKVDKELPILICHGDTDYVNDIEGSRKFLEKLKEVPGMKNKKIIEYRNGRHELFIDRPEIRDKVINDVVEFLDSIHK
ncbi:DEBR0S2_05028g1_1 [Brettanomyces bruxellensis]|uniref:DEBR0S2_05028g1_1 n=1 Tax=Dekkera bruxellensis TaxID=5007 RepID=A0A7D9CXK3_DEKBR|nr:DEBR0S2_05028g1_1 [Brettanomyces bruxellensis]